MKPSEIKEIKFKISRWIFSGYAMMWYGKILSSSQELLDRMKKQVYPITHEKIHIKQAVSTENSFKKYYKEYIKRYIKLLPYAIRYGFDFEIPYVFNPFEMEAYAFQNDEEYVNTEKCEGWKVFDKMTKEQRKKALKEWDNFNWKKQVFFKKLYDSLTQISDNNDNN